jgi:hypothetical protein
MTSPADREQLQAQVTDLGQQAMQRRLVGERAGDDGLAGLVAGDAQTLKPGRPAAVQDTLDADLVVDGLDGWVGRLSTSIRPGHRVSRATTASRMLPAEEHSAQMAYRRAVRANALVCRRRVSSHWTRS